MSRLTEAYQKQLQMLADEFQSVAIGADDLRELLSAYRDRQRMREALGVGEPPYDLASGEAVWTVLQPLVRAAAEALPDCRVQRLLWHCEVCMKACEKYVQINRTKLNAWAPIVRAAIAFTHFYQSDDDLVPEVLALEQAVDALKPEHRPEPSDG